MAAYDKLKELISKIEDSDTKSSFDSFLSELNTEKGKALADLNKIKSESESQKRDAMTLAEIAKAASEAGIEVKDNKQLVDLAKNFGNSVDKDSTLTQLNEMLEAERKEKSDLASKVKQIEVRDTMLPLLEKARAEFKDKDGNAVVIKDGFLDKDFLTKDVDISQEAIVLKKVNDTLEKALVDQNSFLKENGLALAGEAVHSVDENGVGISNRSNGVNLMDLKKDHWDESKKDTNAAAELLARYRIAAEEQGE